MAFLLFLAGVAFIAILYVKSQKFMEFSELVYKASHSLSKVPGPKSYPIVGAAWQFKIRSQDFFHQLEEWFWYFGVNDPNRMGLLKIWVGPIPFAAIVFPDYIKDVLESNTLIRKSSNYDIVRQWIGDGLLMSSDEKWMKRRKMLTPAFHFNVLKGYADVFTRQGEILVDQMEGEADTGRECDVFPYVKRCALDVICETAMGTTMNSQLGGSMEYVDAVVRLSDIIWSYQRFPWLWVPPIWYACGLGFEFDRLVKLTGDFTRKVIHDRKAALEEEGHDGPITEAEIKKRKPCFIDLLLLMQKANALSDEDIREEVDTFMFAGHDTTASSMGFVIWFIGQKPEVQEKVHAELDNIFGDDDKRHPDENDVRRLEYMEKCIKEALRLAPSVPFIGRHLTHDVTIGPVDLPKNLTCLLSPFGAHRDASQWETPHEFNPDHFDTEASSKRHPYAYLPFSAGPRNCIGQKFALAEVKIVLSWVFRRYLVESVEPYPGNDIVPEVERRMSWDANGVLQLVLKPLYGFKVRLFRRIRA